MLVGRLKEIIKDIPDDTEIALTYLGEPLYFLNGHDPVDNRWFSDSAFAKLVKKEGIKPFLVISGDAFSFYEHEFEES